MGVIFLTNVRAAYSLTSLTPAECQVTNARRIFLAWAFCNHVAEGDFCSGFHTNTSTGGRNVVIECKPLASLQLNIKRISTVADRVRYFTVQRNIAPCG